MLPLARGGGAKLSDEGVLFAIVGQKCKVTPDSSHAGNTLVDATLAIEVGNPTAYPVALHRAGFDLTISGRASVRTPVREEATQPDSVEPGSTARFELRFLGPGTCTQEMELLPNAALELQGRPIQIGAIRFVPVAPP
jgi:hypothetical protein